MSTQNEKAVIRAAAALTVAMLASGGIKDGAQDGIAGALPMIGAELLSPFSQWSAGLLYAALLCWALWRTPWLQLISDPRRQHLLATGVIGRHRMATDQFTGQFDDIAHAPAPKIFLKPLSLKPCENPPSPVITTGRRISTEAETTAAFVAAPTPCAPRAEFIPW